MPGLELIGFAGLSIPTGSALLDGSEADGTNLLTGGQVDFTSQWTTINATLTANNQVASDGNTTAARFLEAATSDRHGVYILPTITANTTYSFSVYAKQNTRRYLQIYIVGAGAAGAVAAYFDLQSGAVTDSGVITAGTGTSIGTPTIAAAVNGYYKCTIPTFKINNTDTGAYVQLMGSTTSTQAGSSITSGNPSYAGSTSAGLDLWRPKLV